MPARKRPRINKQQEHILLLALFMLKHLHHQSRPEKRQVLNYIELRNYLLIREADLSSVSGGEDAWRNDIAWRRQDLKDQGFLRMPAHGEWEITADGEQALVSWCASIKTFADARPDWEERLDDLEESFGEKVVLAKNAISAALQVYEIASAKFPHYILQSSEPPRLSDILRAPDWWSIPPASN